MVNGHKVKDSETEFIIVNSMEHEVILVACM
jgi:hypothetical protein